jgi:hypothetical protein
VLSEQAARLAALKTRDGHTCIDLHISISAIVLDPGEADALSFFLRRLTLSDPSRTIEFMGELRFQGPSRKLPMVRYPAALLCCSILLCVLSVVLSPVAQARRQEHSRRQPQTEATFLVEPYLQLPTTTAMTIMWETSDKLSSRVEYGKDSVLDSVVESKAPKILHEVRLHGLQPGTTYQYRVRSGPLVSETYHFRTAPPSGTKRWRMALYGDSRSNPDVHRQVVEQIAKANVDLIVHTGDIVLDGRNHESWREQFFDALAPLDHGVPWVSTIGNHERDSAHYFSYMALPGNERYFGFDYANAHIICLDSNAWIEKGRDSEQYQWLSDHLGQKREATWTLVAFHHPLFSAHRSRPINSLRWDWAPLFLDPLNRIDGVFTGHDHFYARNYRMGRLADKLQPGVLFMTSAGGGASLYPTKQRGYIATEKEAHHFVLFEFDGDRVQLSPIDIAGKVIDRYELTKESTPPDEFCAYETEELRQFLRLALAAAPAIASSGSDPIALSSRLSVPTRFQVPVAGRMIWESVPGWKLTQAEVPFQLKPGQPLEIPLEGEVEPGPLPKSPALTITFEPGRFRNRSIEVHPFKLAGPETLLVKIAEQPPDLDGKLLSTCWTLADKNPRSRTPLLLGLRPPGGRRDRIEFLFDNDWLYFGARLDDPDGKIEVQPSDHGTDGGRLVLFAEHVRLILWDGKSATTFAISPEQTRYSNLSAGAGTAPSWKAVAGRQPGAWCVEMAIPRKLIADLAKVRVNVVHHHCEERSFVDYELCPTYTLGTDPDLLPDWVPADKVSEQRLGEAATHFTRLVTQEQ